MDLDHNFSAGHRVMMHIRIEVSETARRKIPHLGFIKAIEPRIQATNTPSTLHRSPP